MRKTILNKHETFLSKKLKTNKVRLNYGKNLIIKLIMSMRRLDRIVEDCSDLDPYVVAKRLFKIVRSELLFHISSTGYLSREERASLYRYYCRMLRKNPLRESHYFAQRIKNVVKVLLYNNEQEISILDSGCGFGTESLVFALLGGKVLGIDLNPERLAVAMKRVTYYKKLNPKLKVTFKLCNILKYKCKSTFNVIYAKEFISHVHPVSKFIEFAWKCLKPGGYLVIHDTNPLNPYCSYKAWRAHKHSLYKFVKDPETGENIMYAVERLVPSFILKRLLRANNFKILSINYYGWIGPNLFLPLINSIETKLKVPITPLYEIVSMKSKSGNEIME